jgi:hypothetical protein
LDLQQEQQQPPKEEEIDAYSKNVILIFNVVITLLDYYNIV